jgi:hypothetical protein
MRLCIIRVVLCALLFSCASTDGGESGDGLFPEETGDGLSLEQAVERSAAELGAKLPPGTRVAIVAFDSC